MAFLQGKHILITGLLSNRSIAYGIAKACHREGAEPGVHLCRRTLPRAHHRVCGGVWQRAGIRLRCRQRRADRRRVQRPGAALAATRWPGACDRLCAARSDRRRLSRRPVARKFSHRARYFRLQLPRHGQGRPAAAAAGRLAADPDLPGRHARRALLQHHGPGQGVAGGLGALPGRVARAARHPRQRHFGRPDQDPGRLRHQGLRQIAGLSSPNMRRCAAMSPSRKSATRRPFCCPTWPPASRARSPMSTAAFRK